MPVREVCTEWHSILYFGNIHYLLYCYNLSYINTFFWRAPQQMLRTHHNLKAYCVTLWWRWSVCSFLRVMEHRWNEIDRGKPKYSAKNLSLCHFVHHKSHIDWLGIEPEPPRGEAGDTNRMGHGTSQLIHQWQFKCQHVFVLSLSFRNIIFQLNKGKWNRMPVSEVYMHWLSSKHTMFERSPAYASKYPDRPSHASAIVSQFIS
jgi:hypothetical protein